MVREAGFVSEFLDSGSSLSRRIKNTYEFYSFSGIHLVNVLEYVDGFHL